MGPCASGSKDENGIQRNKKKGKKKNLVPGQYDWEDEEVGPYEWQESERVEVDFEKETIIIDGRITIQIKFGSICAQTTDAVTNAANSKLSHGSGVAGRIREKGGDVIVQESTEWIEKYGQVKTGTCAWTNAGKLPCKYVIHAVGPIYSKVRVDECNQQL